MTDADRAAKAAAEVKRARRAEKLAGVSFVPITVTGSPGPSFARAEKRREYKATTTFNHGSAKAAAMRHREARKGKPRVVRKAFTPKPHDPVDHVHPRHKREWMRSQAAAQ